MNLLKPSLLLLVSLVLCLTGCVGPKPHNIETAKYKKVGNRFLVEVTGTRWGVVHDPIALMAQKTYPASQQFDLPRIEGLIEGREIHQKPGHYSYLGSISIHGATMSVDLTVDNYDDKRVDPCSWNGTYVLVESEDLEERVEGHPVKPNPYLPLPNHSP